MGPKGRTPKRQSMGWRGETETPPDGAYILTGKIPGENEGPDGRRRQDKTKQ